MSRVKDIISDPTLTYQQQLLALARLAENDDDSLPLKPEMKKALEEETLCDLGEGRAPYRPRYILPDYQKLMIRTKKKRVKRCVCFYCISIKR